MFEYDETFYKNIEETKADEKIIMPLIMQWISPDSIVDFGCGGGLWLDEAVRQKIQIDILGIDGSYAKKSIRIPEEKFMAADLRYPIILKRKYDLAISTEVAEHLEEQYADTLVDSIARAADQILFSAAVPGQHGTHHINEQWQSYWIDKFEKRGYYCDYSVRNYFWDDERINSWRRQNLLFFSRRDINIAPAKKIIDVIHPEERPRIEHENLYERLAHYILHPYIYAMLDKAVAKLVRSSKYIAIYPYGINGQLCEAILKAKYGVIDYVLVDNIVKMEGKKIFTAEELSRIDNIEQICVINTCSNPNVYKEVLECINKYFDIDKIYSVFEFMQGWEKD